MSEEEEKQDRTAVDQARKECTICKHLGHKTQGSLERAQLFDEVGTPISIYLCRAHSVELFRSGQKKFLLSHYKILVDVISSDETKFLDVLEKTIRSNMDDIF
ncbi:MAG: hypothetical protein CME62_16540 [Halobacteriovoraceae bacterium]|nr:hypothetical protein [Halobacteriovoraceae bacterium]|tara:strand:+ start:126 stop:434 length:309 start_codon:yes stop_codon:yes gene_type:complete